MLKKYFLQTLIFFLLITTYADEVGEKEYVINPEDSTRKISMTVFNRRTSEIVPVYEIVDLLTGKTVTPQALFSVGLHLPVQIKFKDFETIEEEIVITPGQGSFQIYCDRLDYLKTYSFQLYKPQPKIDGVEYNVKVFIDEQDIENHLIEVNQSKNNWEYTLKGYRYAQDIKIAIGFFYGIIEASNNNVVVYSLKDIDMNLYISHLNKIVKKDDMAMQTIHKFVRANQSFLRKNSHEDIEKLIEYLYSLEISSRDNRTFDKILFELEKIQGNLE